jgi:hypothetical protein
MRQTRPTDRVFLRVAGLCLSPRVVIGQNFSECALVARNRRSSYASS